MGLAVDDDDSPSPPPASPPPVWQHPHHPLFHPGGPHPMANPMALAGSPQNPGLDLPATLFGLSAAAAASLSGKATHEPGFHHHPMSSTLFNRKRQFDVASLLAPEKDSSGGALSPNSYKSDEQDRDQSLSSPSPPPGSEAAFKRSKSYRHDSSDDDDESIEVTDDGMSKPSRGHHLLSRKYITGHDDNENDDVTGENNESGKVCHNSAEKLSHGHDSDSSREASSPQTVHISSTQLISPKDSNNLRMHHRLGQRGTISGDEDDSNCKSINYSLSNRSNLSHPHSPHNMVLARSGGDRLSSNNNNFASSDNNGNGESSTDNENVSSSTNNPGIQQNNMPMPNFQLLNHQNVNQGGGLPSLEILHAHYLAQQQQSQQNHHSHQIGAGGQGPQFPFGIPGGSPFPQGNPSLAAASILMFSSKYRELAMNAAALKRSQP